MGLTLWFDKMFIHNDTFYVMTLASETILFNANTGEIIRKENSLLTQKKFDINKLPELKKEYPANIKYPEKYQFPV